MAERDGDREWGAIKRERQGERHTHRQRQRQAHRETETQRHRENASTREPVQRQVKPHAGKGEGLQQREFMMWIVKQRPGARMQSKRIHW